MVDGCDLFLVPMSEAHLDAVLAIEQVVFPSPWTRRDFEISLARENGICRMVMLGNCAIGYAIGFVSSGEFHLGIFAIAPSHQRRGFGCRALSCLLGALDASVHVASLEVRMSNGAAIALYQRMGFHTVAIQPDYYMSPREDALVMVKALKGQLSDWVVTRVAKL